MHYIRPETTHLKYLWRYLVIASNLDKNDTCAQTLKARNHARAIWKSAKHAFTGGLKPIQSLLCFAIITLTLPSSPSLRADLIYNVGLQSGVGGQTLRSTTDYAGNSFLTSSAPATLNSISLYLGLQGDINLETDMFVYPTGTLYLDIYTTTATGGLYVPNLSTKLATASINVSTLTTNSYPSTLTSFNYTGVNAITLSANTNYAFSLNASEIYFPSTMDMMTGINYRLNLTNPYTNGNMFNNSNANGSSSIDMSGEIDVTTAVPEPGTMILFGVTMAIGGAAAVIRKRRKRNAD
jgi:hypothetical protein